MQTMKFGRWSLLATALVLGACAGDGGGDPTAPEDVRISVSSGDLELTVGATEQLTATVTGASNTTVVWSVDDESVVSVSSSGMVTALSAGSARITAAAAADMDQRATVDVEVTASTTALESGVSATNLSGAEDSETLFRITVPEGAARLVVTTQGGTGDVDLYLLSGAPEDGGEVVCVSEEFDNAESCTVDAPVAGDWYVVLFGWEAYSGVTLLATVEMAPPPGETRTPTLFTGTTGSGYGTVTPATAEHEPGTRILVQPEADAFYEFSGWEGDFCPSTIDYRPYSFTYNGCYVTMQEEDVHAIARFEPITFTANPSASYTVTSSTCSWNNSLQDMVATVTFTRRDGVDYAQVKVEGKRVYSSSQEGCTSSTSNVSASEEVAMTGAGLTVELVLGQGSSSKETLTLSAMDLTIDKETLGAFSYSFTGTDRSGSHSQPLMPWTAVVK